MGAQEPSWDFVFNTTLPLSYEGRIDFTCSEPVELYYLTIDIKSRKKRYSHSSLPWIRYTVSYMFKRIEPLPEQSPRERSEKLSEALSPEILRIQNDVQSKLIQRSRLKDDPLQWTERYGGAFGVIFDSDRDKFINIYKENPEELYKIFLDVFQNVEEEDGPDHS